MRGSASAAGSAMWMMAAPLMQGQGSTLHNPICSNGPNCRSCWDRESQQRRLRKEREELVRSEKAYVAGLERLMMPLVLPDHLSLRETQVGFHEGDRKIGISSHGFKITENAEADSLLVGYRYGSRFKNRIDYISLCLGKEWYGSSNGPFLKASNDGKKSFTIKYRSEYPDSNSNCVRVINTTGSKLGTTFEMVAADLTENTPILHEFEWYHRQTYQLGDQEPQVGTFLVLKSMTHPPQVVARMDWGEGKPHKVLTGAFDIVFMGAGLALGGTWKIIVFVIGILGFY